MSIFTACIHEIKTWCFIIAYNFFSSKNLQRASWEKGGMLKLEVNG
jgi:hypothetical protein